MSYIRIRGYVCKVGVHREGVHMHARLPGLQSSPGAAVALVSCPARRHAHGARRCLRVHQAEPSVSEWSALRRQLGSRS